MSLPAETATIVANETAARELVASAQVAKSVTIVTPPKEPATLPALQHDPNRPEDVLKVDADDEGLGGDDAADCLRYLVATKR